MTQLVPASRDFEAATTGWVGHVPFWSLGCSSKPPVDFSSFYLESWRSAGGYCLHLRPSDNRVASFPRVSRRNPQFMIRLWEGLSITFTLLSTGWKPVPGFTCAEGEGIVRGCDS